MMFFAQTGQSSLFDKKKTEENKKIISGGEPIQGDADSTPWKKTKDNSASYKVPSLFTIVMKSQGYNDQTKTQTFMRTNHKIVASPPPIFGAQSMKFGSLGLLFPRKFYPFLGS